MGNDDELPPRSWFPPGLIGDCAYFIMRAAPHPNKDIALAAAIAFFAGITGRAYNTYTFAGLNLYILVLAKTAMGKEAANSGISKLLAAISAKIPAAKTFKGPMLISSAGLLKWLAENPSCVTVGGEWGYKLKAMHSVRVPLETTRDCSRALARLIRKTLAGEMETADLSRFANAIMLLSRIIEGGDLATMSARLDELEKRGLH